VVSRRLSAAGRRLEKRRSAPRLYAAVVFLLLMVAGLSGCGHKPVQANAPPAPEIKQPAAKPQPRTSGRDRRKAQPAPSEAGDEDQDAAADEDRAAEAAPEAKRRKSSRPLLVEEGLASWYGPPYHNRRSADGNVYNQNAMTAAHRTLPLNSVVRVTNVATQKSAIVRITDRGPFIRGRVIDLSLAAAKAVDVWGPGVAQVKLEVLETPAPVEHGGRWCVQIGAFSDAGDAGKLKQKLASRYHTAKVLQFTGPTGEWLRVRVLNDEKARAESVARETKTDEGAVFLVRMD
jgi:rare lipoprotein A